MYQGEIVQVEIPASVELTISDTEPGIQGDRVSGARKPATLETGKVIQVPLFISPGERVKVDTRTGEYITAGLSHQVARRSGEGEDLRSEARERALGFLVRGRDEVASHRKPCSTRRSSCRTS